MKFFFISFICFLKLAAAQDLTRQDPIEKVVYFKGKAGEAHYYEPNKLIFLTGKLYKLILKNQSNSKHYFTSDSFAKAIFTRKIQVKNNLNKLAEIKGAIYEIEVGPNHEIEWWFVPIKTGYFEDLYCKVIDSKNGLKHSDMGMRGIIIIK